MKKTGTFVFLSELIENHRIAIDILLPSKTIRLIDVHFPFYKKAQGNMKSFHKIKLKDYEPEDYEKSLKTFGAWRKIYQKLPTSQTLITELREKILKEIQ